MRHIYKLTHNKAIALVMAGYGNKFISFVPIANGAFIMVDSGTFSLMAKSRFICDHCPQKSSVGAESDKKIIFCAQ